MLEYGGGWQLHWALPHSGEEPGPASRGPSFPAVFVNSHAIEASPVTGRERAVLSQLLGFGDQASFVMM